MQGWLGGATMDVLPLTIRKEAPHPASITSITGHRKGFYWMVEDRLDVGGKVATTWPSGHNIEGRIVDGYYDDYVTQFDTIFTIAAGNGQHNPAPEHGSTAYNPICVNTFASDMSGPAQYASTGQRTVVDLSRISPYQRSRPVIARLSPLVAQRSSCRQPARRSMQLIRGPSRRCS